MSELNEGKLNRWIRSEVAIAFTIGSMVAGSVVWIMSPIAQLNTEVAVIKQQLTELKTNGIVHIELEQAKMGGRLDEQGKQITELDKKLAEILVILRQRP